MESGASRRSGRCKLRARKRSCMHLDDSNQNENDDKSIDIDDDGVSYPARKKHNAVDCRSAGSHTAERLKEVKMKLTREYTSLDHTMEHMDEYPERAIGQTVAEENGLSKSTTIESGFEVNGNHDKSSGAEPEPGSSSSCTSKTTNDNILNDLVMIDTPPSSVQDEDSLGMEEEPIPFTPEQTPMYFEQNKMLYKLYRERLARSGARDLYRNYSDGYKSSSEPWPRR